MTVNIVFVYFPRRKRFQNNVRRYSELIKPNDSGRATFLIEQTKLSIAIHSFKSHLQRQFTFPHFIMILSSFFIVLCFCCRSSSNRSAKRNWLR